MIIRIAHEMDVEIISTHDKHIKKEELEVIISLNRVILAEDEGG